MLRSAASPPSTTVPRQGYERLAQGRDQAAQHDVGRGRQTGREAGGEKNQAESECPLPTLDCILDRRRDRHQGRPLGSRSARRQPVFRHVDRVGPAGVALKTRSQENSSGPGDSNGQVEYPRAELSLQPDWRRTPAQPDFPPDSSTVAVPTIGQIRSRWSSRAYSVNRPQTSSDGELARQCSSSPPMSSGRPTPPANKQERERLRHERLRQGHTIKQMAEEMARLWRLRSRRAWRYANGFTQDEVARLLNELHEDPRASMTGRRISEYEVWPENGQVPSPDVLIGLATVLGAAVADLLDQADLDALPTRTRRVLDSIVREQASPNGPPGAPTPQSSAAGETTDSRLVDAGEAHRAGTRLTRAAFRRVFQAAADEARRHAERMEMRVMPTPRLEELTEDTIRLAREHLYINSVELFGETLRTRDHVYRLIDAGQRPDDARELHHLASILCSLLADTSASVGFLRECEELARAAGSYAEIIGHNGLRVWSKTMIASVAHWNGRPRRAYEIQSSALKWARSDPIYEIQLRNGTALFHACMGDRSAALADLHAAEELREGLNDRNELFDDIGGMFAYPHARQSQIATMTWIQLEEYGRAAESGLEALRLYQASPPESRAFGNEASAAIDIGLCHVLAGDLDAARERLQPVFDLPPAQRQEWFMQKLRSLAERLSSRRYARSTAGTSLRDEIEEFCTFRARDEFPH